MDSSIAGEADVPDVTVYDSSSSSPDSAYGLRKSKSRGANIMGTIMGTFVQKQNFTSLQDSILDREKDRKKQLEQVSFVISSNLLDKAYSVDLQARNSRLTELPQLPPGV